MSTKSLLLQTAAMLAMADGFLLGFAYHTGFNTGIYPSIAKRKKDGTPSKVEHPTWNIMPFMCITSIEIIDTTPET